MRVMMIDMQLIELGLICLVANLLVVHPLILRLTGISTFNADDGIPIFGILAILIPPVVSALFALGIVIYSQKWLFRSYSRWSNLVAGE